MVRLSKVGLRSQEEGPTAGQMCDRNFLKYMKTHCVVESTMSEILAQYRVSDRARTARFIFF